MMEPALPSGFDAFWQETVSEALKIPLNFHLDSGDAFDLEGFRVSTYTFFGVGGQQKFGWKAVPEESGPHPAFLWVPPYGRESLLPNAYGTRKGFVSASLNFFGHEAFHQEKYKPERGYFSEGVLSEKTWVMRGIFQDAVVALRILREQPEVNSEQIGVMGMSQGGGISIWLGAWVSFVKAVCADMPFLGGMSQVLGQHVYRYPLKELMDTSANIEGGLERIKKTISFFDTLNQATRCKVPTHLSLGEKDPAVKPLSVEAIFAALPGEKVLERYATGHDWFPDMIGNNRTWLLDNLTIA
ncbi:MAG TPA: acetylxylan esterase [Fimbriimonadaceae bacterium]|jgi:cephalosporin-C deacetylase